MLKIPPHNLDAEKAVLWSIMIDKEGLAVVWDKVKKDDFYDERNSHIYEVLQDLYDKHRPIDLLTVSSELKNKQKLEEVWGNAYLIELTNIVPSSSNIWEYWDIVKKKSVLRRLIKASDKMWALAFDEDEKLWSVLEKAEQELFKVTQTFVDNKLVHIKDIVDQRFEEFSEIHENPEMIENHRVNFGFPSLDNTLGWVKQWDLVILAARPAMGKTAFALNIARNVWAPEPWAPRKNIAIFSLEMSKEQLTDRMIAAAMWIDSWKLSKWELEDEEFMKIWDAMETLSKSNIYIDDSAWWDLMDLKSKCRRLKMQSWLDIVIIDYLQLMSNWNQMNRVQEISEISRWLKQLARELQVPIIALSQLSRAVEWRPDKRPVLSDLRESGSIEQDADSVLMLYREEYYEEFTEKKGVTSVFVRKNRSWPVWSCDLMFQKQYQKFVEIDQNHQYQSQWAPVPEEEF